MSIRLTQLSDNLRTAVLDGGLVIYFLPPMHDNVAQNLRVYGYEGVALVSGDKVVGGVTLLAVSDEWYHIELLWADSAVAAVTLIYATIEHYKKILPSESISPAAQAMVKRFYDKYKGTGVVVEHANSDIYSRSPELQAGYLWSPKLRKVPVKVGQPETEDQTAKLWKAVLQGFATAYSDPTKTKFENPDNHMATSNLEGLLKLLQKWISRGGDKQQKALDWIEDHRSELEQMDNRQTKAILSLSRYTTL